MASVARAAEVFVIGGGPAGLAAAIAARRRGFDVTVADAAHPPIDKACGEGLMPDSFAALRRLGISLRPDEGFSFRGIRLIDGSITVDANFSSQHGVALRRTRLHEILIEHAMDAGVKLLWGTRVIGIGEERVMLDGGVVRCRWIIGADGQNSRVRRWAGLEAARHETSRFGFRRHYRMTPWSDYVEIYWGRGCEMYVAGVGPNEVCASMLTRDQHLRFDAALAQFPEIERRLAGAVPASAERGAVAASRRLKRVFRGRTVLIGDASGSVDAITGEGMSLAFQQAPALADALESDDLGAYEAAHRRLVRRPATMAGLLLLLDRHAWFRGCVMRVFQWKPAIFASLLAVHAGEAFTAPAQYATTLRRLPQSAHREDHRVLDGRRECVGADR